ncbi:MAG: TonB-dependent receptor, partial [Candidatus Kapabacteria bacterium]|nr:TonB-dependent receptor [Candidatus Kapabacteria bacterium]
PKAWTTDPVLRRANLSAFGYDSTGRNLDYTVRRRYQEIENFSQPHVELLNDVQLSDNITLKSSLFYYTGTGFFDFDGSWADTTTLRLGAAFSGVRPTANPGNTIIRAFVGNRQGGWIPRFIINHDKGELTVGAEYREHRSEHWGKIRFADNLPAGLDPDYKIYSYNGTRTILSGFVREQYRASETLLLNAEAQLVHSRYGLMNERAGTTFTSYQSADGSRVGNGGTIFTVDYFFINPRLGAMYAADDANNLYTSIAYTSREPRRNNLYAASESYFGASPLFESDTTGGVIKYDFTRPLIKPEHLLNWEFGWTYKTPAIQLGATGYVMYFINELVRSGRRDIFGAPIEGNAPRVIHTGIELQGSGVLYSSGATIFAVTANATFSRNRIIEYQFQTSGSSLDLNGNPVAGFPDMMGKLRFSQTSGTFQAGLALRHVGRMYSDNFGSRIDEYVRQSPGFIGYRDNLVDAFTVANADISYSIGSLLGIRSLRFRLVVNNLFNTLYVSGANGAEFFPAAERNWFSGLEVEL